jgi:sigma-E factor negative regulatory protein RseA
MKTRISALMDGELEQHEISETLRALRSSPEMRKEWCDCQLVGAALRREVGLEIDVTARVMSAIETEPTVMAPKPRREVEWRRPALALAASAAGVAVVAWLALTPGSDPAPLLAAAPAEAKRLQVATQLQSTPRLQEYLVAHQAYAPSGAMVGGARNIRTVAASGEGR